MSRLNRRQSKICSHGERNTDLVRMTLPLVSSKSVASNDSDDHNQAPVYSLRLRDRHLHQHWWSIFTDNSLPSSTCSSSFLSIFHSHPPTDISIGFISSLLSSPRQDHPSALIILHSLVLFSVIPKRHNVQ